MNTKRCIGRGPWLRVRGSLSPGAELLHPSVATRELTLKIFNTGSKWVHLNVTGRAVSCVNIPAGMVKVLASKSEVWVPPHGEKIVRLHIYTQQDASCTIEISLLPFS